MRLTFSLRCSFGTRTQTVRRCASPPCLAFHPLLAAADTRLLASIDETYAKGVFRRWARLTEIAVPLARRRGDTTLTTDTARAALAAMPQ